MDIVRETTEGTTIREEVETKDVEMTMMVMTDQSTSKDSTNPRNKRTTRTKTVRLLEVVEVSVEVETSTTTNLVEVLMETKVSETTMIKTTFSIEVVIKIEDKADSMILMKRTILEVTSNKSNGKISLWSNFKRTSMSKTNVSENVILPSFVLTERSTKLLCTPTHECSLRNCLIPSSNSMRLTFLRRSAENLTDLDSKLHLRFRLKDGPLL